MERKDIEFVLLIVTAIGAVVTGSLAAYEFAKKATMPERLIVLLVIAACLLLAALYLGWRVRSAILASLKRTVKFVRGNPTPVGVLVGSSVAICLLLYLLERQTQSIELTAIAAALIVATGCLTVAAAWLLPTTHLRHLESPDGGLMIHTATYGTEERMHDVTDIVKYQVKDGKLELKVSNDNLNGDPAPLEAKKLRVVYTHDGERQSVAVDEWKTLSLP